MTTEKKQPVKKAPAKKAPAKNPSSKPTEKVVKVVVKVGEIFYGKGSQAKRYRRGDLVDIRIGHAEALPKWAETIEEAQKRQSTRKTAEVPEPKTLSEMNKKTGPEKAFGQEV